MKKIVLAIALLIGIQHASEAQQQPRFSQYMFNQMVLNPAYTGSTETFSASLLGRYQWVGIEGAPQTGTIGAHAALGDAKKIGVGGFISYDRIGVTQTMGAFATYSYKFILGESRLSMGISGGLNYLSTDDSQLHTNGEMENVTIDPSFNQGNLRKTLPNFGLGLYYYNPRKFYIGFSAPHLLNNNLRSDNTVAVVAHQFRHYNFMAGAILGQGMFKFRPSVLVKAVPVNAPLQVDLSGLVLIKDMIWIGGSYRTPIGSKDADGQTLVIDSESANAIVAFQKDGWKIGYAYDFTITQLRQFTNGSHEVSLTFDMKQKGVRVHTPRFF
ncbi:MAG: type IX secretion system membrane protein PorP/SprF [Chitinophagales bacterium]|jgi:type IX secretion system PorP/SprF family membrane protein|nr:type IX secretion system membrane protein PorP/SprF [Chitinophagales bacterium]